MSSFNGSQYISCILINNENTSSGNYLTLVKTTLLTGQCGVTVVASLPTSPSRDVTANIPIRQLKILMPILNEFQKISKHQIIFSCILLLCMYEIIISVLCYHIDVYQFVYKLLHVKKLFSNLFNFFSRIQYMYLRFLWRPQYCCATLLYICIYTKPISTTGLTTVKHLFSVWHYFRELMTLDLFTRLYFREYSFLVL